MFFYQNGHFHEVRISEKGNKLIGLLHVLATKTELKMTKPSDKDPLGMSLITASNCKVHYISFSDKDIILANLFFIRLDYLVNPNPFCPDFQSSIISPHLQVIQIILLSPNRVTFIDPKHSALWLSRNFYIWE